MQRYRGKELVYRYVKQGNKLIENLNVRICGVFVSVYRLFTLEFYNQLENTDQVILRMIGRKRIDEANTSCTTTTCNQKN